MTEILLVDDDTLFASSAKGFLEKRGMHVQLAETLESARTLLSPRTDVVILDRNLPDGVGEELLPAIRRQARQALILRTSAADWSTRGEVGPFLLKPFPLEALLKLIHQLVVDGSALFAGEAMTSVLRDVHCFAASDCPVIFTGETGTGKTQLARFLHRVSRRAKGPFSSINCAAITPSLLEAELFGVERGAFTGALHARAGIFEACNGGTVLLDEVAELTPAAQGALLHVLEEGWIRRVGRTDLISVDVRVLVASHEDLEQAVAAHQFREDLYFRLAVAQVAIPPLRRRSEDLGAIVSRLLQLMGEEGELQLAPGELERLAAHPLPGNIRQLRNLLERACLLHDRRHLRPSLFLEPAPSGSSSAPSTTVLETLQEVERAHIAKVLAAVGGVRAEAARVLGIGEATLRRKLREARSQTPIDLATPDHLDRSNRSPSPKDR